MYQMGLQDPSLKVRREYIQVSTEPFNLPKPGSAEALATLETPSGKPYQCVPLEPKQDVTGSFAGFNYPAKSAKADPAVVSFMIGFRDNGEDFGGSLSCGCAVSIEWKGNLVTSWACPGTVDMFERFDFQAKVTYNTTWVKNHKYYHSCVRDMTHSAC